MLSILAAAILASTFTIYPGPKAPDARIEAVTDRGPILEIIVRCPAGTAIITYSKMERLYCDPRLACDNSRQAVIQRTCG